ncbi:hypothetical protein LBMAG27_07300 [Bacteroidota bacterium]|nr:hypothetical protein LBMAG27_07300 [Bacteroidota bacterium]
MKPLKINKDLLDYYGVDGPPPETPIQDMIQVIAMRTSMALGGAVATKPNRAKDQHLSSLWKIDPISPALSAKYLADAFDYGTPKDGSVFWSSVDKNKVVTEVRKMNKAAGKIKFGSLESTTDARFVDGAFKYEAGVNKDFWKLASAKYGEGALGHVTVFQVFGLKEDTIFWKDEFPEVLNGMNKKLSVGVTPDVCDITIAVINPVNWPSLKVKLYTNADICRIPIVVSKNLGKDKNGWDIRPTKREEVKMTKTVGSGKIPITVRNYWEQKGTVLHSAAAREVESNPRSVVYDSFLPFM